MIQESERQEIIAQVKAALQVLKRSTHELIHPADRQFAELLLTRPISQATLLKMAVRATRNYRHILQNELGMQLPRVDEIEEMIKVELYAGLGEFDPFLDEEPPQKLQHVYIAHQRILVEFPYTNTIHMAISPLKSSVPGWEFNKYERKEWSFPLESMTLVAKALATLEPWTVFEYSRAAIVLRQRGLREEAYQQEINLFEQLWQDCEQDEALNRVAHILDHPMLSDGRILFTHQREAIERMVKQGRLVLAHDMGLGKTMSSLLAARCYGRPVFVIAPISTHIPWLREAECAGVGIEIYSWAKLPQVPDRQFVLIGDEAHMIQSLSSQRTQAFLSLAEHATAVFCVTGTPMKNAMPLNLFPLLIACKHPLSMMDLRSYENRYCAGSVRRIGKRNIYEATGATNLDELHEKTQDVILYKKKTDCLDLPPKIRTFRVAETTPEIDKFYQETIDRLWQEHEARMKARQEKAEAMIEAAKEFGEDIDPAILDAAKGNPTFAQALVEMGILRHAASLAKVTAALTIAEEILEQGGQVVLFSVYKETARQIALLLGADCLTGEVNAKRRQQMIDRFQAGESQVLACTPAGGLGITLTAAQTVVLIERAWTPGDVSQAEDRLHRIGQMGTVTSIWLQYGPMDERVDDLLEKKQKIIDHVLTGEESDLESAGVSRSVLSSAREIIRSIHEGIPLDLLLSQREKELMAQAEAAMKARQEAAQRKVQATVAKIAQEKRRPGRPRKGGEEAGVRRGFEISLDEKTLEQLTARTSNRSAYIERLILEDEVEDDPDQLKYLQGKLHERLHRLPPLVIKQLQEIAQKRGVRAAYEASEAVILYVDPQRNIYP